VMMHSTSSSSVRGSPAVAMVSIRFFILCMYYVAVVSPMCSY
jgi:hypothetical protein